jgi:uncharacterized membrane protein
MFDYWMLISAILFIFIDSVYLQLVRSYFEKQILDVQGSALKVNFLGVALCYIFLIVGINYFIIKPRKSVTDAFLLGIVIYGVYETTNYALFKKWSLLTVFMDTLWGGVLFALTTYIVNMLRGIFKF